MNQNDININTEEQKSEEIIEIRKRLTMINVNIMYKIIACLGLILVTIFIFVKGPSMGATKADMRYLTKVAIPCIIIGEPLGIYRIYQNLAEKKKLQKKLKEFDEVKKES